MNQYLVALLKIKTLYTSEKNSMLFAIGGRRVYTMAIVYSIYLAILLVSVYV